MPVNLESLKASVKILETDKIVKSIQVLMKREKRVGKPTPQTSVLPFKTFHTAAAIVQSGPVTPASTNKITTRSKFLAFQSLPQSTQNIPDTLTFDPEA